MTEPENLVLQQLREIRAMQDEHGSYLNRLQETLREILTRLTGVERLVILLYGQQTESEQHLARLEARVERLEALSK